MDLAKAGGDVPDLEQVERMEDEGGDEATAHPGNQVLVPRYIVL
jgi:hypothetical protein